MALSSDPQVSSQPGCAGSDGRHWPQNQPLVIKQFAMETYHVYMLYVGKSSTNGSPYVEVPEGIGHEIVIVANRQLQTHSH